MSGHRRNRPGALSIVIGDLAFVVFALWLTPGGLAQGHEVVVNLLCGLGVFLWGKELVFDFDAWWQQRRAA